MKGKQVYVSTLKPKENTSLILVDDESYNPEVDMQKLNLINHGVVPNRSKRSMGTRSSSFAGGFNCCNTVEREWNFKEESYSAYRLIKKNMVDKANPCNKAISIQPLKQRILPLSVQNLSTLEAEIPLHDLERSIIEGQAEILRMNAEYQQKQQAIEHAKSVKHLLPIPALPTCFNTILEKTNYLDDEVISKERAQLKSAGLTLKTMKKKLPERSTLRLTQSDAISIESTFMSMESVHGSDGEVYKRGDPNPNSHIVGNTSMGKGQYVKYCSNIVTKQVMKMQRQRQNELQKELQEQLAFERRTAERRTARVVREGYERAMHGSGDGDNQAHSMNNNNNNNMDGAINSDQRLLSVQCCSSSFMPMGSFQPLASNNNHNNSSSHCQTGSSSPQSPYSHSETPLSIHIADNNNSNGYYMSSPRIPPSMFTEHQQQQQSQPHPELQPQSRGEEQRNWDVTAVTVAEARAETGGEAAAPIGTDMTVIVTAESEDVGEGVCIGEVLSPFEDSIGGSLEEAEEEDQQQHSFLLQHQKSESGLGSIFDDSVAGSRTSSPVIEEPRTEADTQAGTGTGAGAGAGRLVGTDKPLSSLFSSTDAADGAGGVNIDNVEAEVVGNNDSKVNVYDGSNNLSCLLQDQLRVGAVPSTTAATVTTTSGAVVCIGELGFEPSSSAVLLDAHQTHHTQAETQARSQSQSSSLVFVAGKDGEYVSSVLLPNSAAGAGGGRGRTRTLSAGVGSGNASVVGVAAGAGLGVTGGGSIDSSICSFTGGGTAVERSLLTPPHVDLQDLHQRVGTAPVSVPTQAQNQRQSQSCRHNNSSSGSGYVLGLGEAGLDKEDEEDGENQQCDDEGDNGILFFNNHNSSSSSCSSQQLQSYNDNVAINSNSCGYNNQQNPQYGSTNVTAVATADKQLSESALILRNSHAIRRVQDFIVHHHDIPRPVTSFPLYTYSDTVQDATRLMPNDSDTIVIEILYDIPWKLLDKERQALGPNVPLNAERNGYLWKHLIPCSLLHTTYEMFKKQVSAALNDLSAAIERPEQLYQQSYPQGDDERVYMHERYQNLDSKLESVSSEKARVVSAGGSTSAPVSVPVSSSGFVDRFDRLQTGNRCRSSKGTKSMCYSYDIANSKSGEVGNAGTGEMRPDTSSSSGIGTSGTSGSAAGVSFSRSGSYKYSKSNSMKSMNGYHISRPSTANTNSLASYSMSMYDSSRPTTSDNIYRSTKLNSAMIQRPKTGIPGIKTATATAVTAGVTGTGTVRTDTTKWKCMAEVSSTKFQGSVTRGDYQLLHASKRSDNPHTPTRRKYQHLNNVLSTVDAIDFGSGSGSLAVQQEEIAGKGRGGGARSEQIKPKSAGGVYSSGGTTRAKSAGNGSRVDSSKFVPEQTHFFTLKYFQASSQSWKSIQTVTDFEHVKLLAHNLIQNPSSGNCLHQNELLQIMIYAVPEKDQNLDERLKITNQAAKLPELVIETGNAYVLQKNKVVTCKHVQSTLNYSPRDGNVEIPTGQNVKYPAPVSKNYHYNNSICSENAKLLTVHSGSNSTSSNTTNYHYHEHHHQHKGNNSSSSPMLLSNSLSTISYGHIPTIVTRAERHISEGLANSSDEVQQSFELHSSSFSGMTNNKTAMGQFASEMLHAFDDSIHKYDNVV